MSQETPSNTEALLLNSTFPLSFKYSTRWLTENPFGSNCLWLTEWLCEAMDLKPGMRVLDLGCGRAKSSIFLAREFDVEVWATDLWISPAENWHRIRDAGVEKRVFPIHADARALPFAPGFFDAIVSADSFHYYGTEESFLNCILHFLQPNGKIGFASTGLVRDFDQGIPKHLEELWSPAAWTIHTANWWEQHWRKTGLVEIEVSDTMPDGWKHWLQWSHAIAECETGISPRGMHYRAITADQGEHLGYIRLVGQRNPTRCLDDSAWTTTLRHLPVSYERRTLTSEK